jgi:magnesium transporter
MRKLAGWAAMIAVPTMIAGIYGMNFEFMPELKWPLGYPLVMGVTLGTCGFLYCHFKRSGWF